MRIFKNKRFAKFAKKEGISDQKLIQAVKEIEAGKIDANLGGGVIKQGVARPKDGKSGGYRTVIIYHQADTAFFVFGFAKNEQASISKAEERDLKNLRRSCFLRLTWCWEPLWPMVRSRR